jgi:CDP-4-dehydro-6-deoxyglucose reductase, E1
MKYAFYKEKEIKKKLCDFVLNSDQLSLGSKCLEFETKFANYQNRKYAVMFNSGSSANLVLIQVLLNLGMLKKGDKVGFSAVTWATNVMPLVQLGLRPMPVDVSLENLNVSSADFLKVLENNELKVLFMTNLLGFCADLDKISEICRQKGIVLIEDNCESLGSVLKGKKLGNFGLASTFSFYVGHHMSTIEGGMVCTDDEAVYDVLLMTRSHGWDRNLDKDKQRKLRKENDIDDFYAKYTFYTSGFNLRSTEINAFIGIEELKHIDEVLRIRNEVFSVFEKAVKGNADFQKFNLEHMEFVSNFAYPVLCKDQELFEKYRRRFIENDVEIRPILSGCMLKQPFFKDYMKENGLNFECPNAEQIHKLGFYIPNNPDLTPEELDLLSSLLGG